MTFMNVWGVAETGSATFLFTKQWHIADEHGILCHMSKRQIITLLGIWVMGFLFLGVPSSWHKAIAIVTGVVIVLVTVSLRPEQPKQKK